MTERDYVDYIWHFRVEDNMSWDACSKFMTDNAIDVTSSKLKNQFLNYFKKEVGIAPYKKCPECGEKLLPRKSKYGYFVGCGGFPNCNFTATKTKPFENK